MVAQMPAEYIASQLETDLSVAEKILVTAQGGGEAPEAEEAPAAEDAPTAPEEAPAAEEASPEEATDSEA